MSASERLWQFWIDVGGTFTDCFAQRPDGSLLRHKVLSSAVTKGLAAAGSTTSLLIDPARCHDPADFWTGYGLSLFDRHGELLEQSRVAHFERSTGALHLASSLQAAPQPGQAYELSSTEEAPILALRYLLGLPLAAELPPVSVRLGTTRGTNALLTRRGARTAFVTTRGLGDVLRIGYQDRPRLFELSIVKPEPLIVGVAELDERIDAEGNVLVPIDREQVRRELARLQQEHIESLAVCLMNAYRNPEHEQIVAELAAEYGFQEISCSHQVAALVKIVARGDTTVVDAYLNPVLRRYVERLRKSLAHERSQLRIMTSAGGLVSADRFSGKDSILSGPAGGVVGFARAAEAAGFTRAIGFDMGGTSTDVSRFDGRFELQYETEKAGVRVVAPMMAIETVAAGGGSICDFDGVKLIVGPDSAGAAPGPACYGRGGPLAVTDLNLVLGRILPESFPFPLDQAAVQQRLEQLIGRIAQSTGRRYEPVELADGLLQVANANMSEAIRSISIAKGYDPRDYVLVAFGGAAAQHACAVARELGIRQILSHPDAGILSAFGIGTADVVRYRQTGVYQLYHEPVLRELDAVFQQLTREGIEEVEQEGLAREQIEVLRLLDLRYRGQDAYLTIPCPTEGTYAESFVDEHRRLYGYAYENRPLEIVAARVEVTGRVAARPDRSRRATTQPARPHREVTAHFGGQAHRTLVYVREQLRPGDLLEGPAIVTESASTTVVDPGWQAEVLTGGELLLNDQIGRRAHVAARADEPRSAVSYHEPDPATLEIFNRQFAAIAQQMGITLRNTSSSVNVKERLDFSCALFTAGGDLIVNAPHIPVHLGAMSETIRCVIADNPDLQPGDVIATNDPYRGGSHLPDITVIAPLHDEQTGELIMFTASRAHHAEIGGITPGSMPPFSTNLAEEGVLIRNFCLVRQGQSRMDTMRELLLSGLYPTRRVEDNLADLAAQIAATQQGMRDLRRMIERYSLPVVQAYMQHIQNAATAKMQQALAALRPGKYHFRDHLDDGSPIEVTITIHASGVVFDFSGTGPVLPNNLNANRAIVTAAVMYTLRLLINEDIPLNQGVLSPVEIILPECLLNPPARERPEDCAAVVGGNVETSQRVVDVLLGALGLAAASQGTMNNLLFGDRSFGYYETIGGGAGATPTRPGADAVHTHMTNTRLTDPEVLEQRYPVRVRTFAIRRGSGGEGLHGGGNGILRSLEFLKPLEVSLLTQRRGPYPPYGLAGGQPGQLGRNQLTRATGQTEQLPGRAQFQVQPGDVLTVETPGGGGWGQHVREGEAPAEP